MVVLGQSELYPLQATLKPRRNPRGNLVSTQRTVLPEELSIDSLPGHCHISYENLCTISFEDDVEFLHYTVSNIHLNESWSSLFARRVESCSRINVLSLNKELRGRLFHSISNAFSGMNVKPEASFCSL